MRVMIIGKPVGLASLIAELERRGLEVVCEEPLHIPEPLPPIVLPEPETVPKSYLQGLREYLRIKY